MHYTSLFNLHRLKFGLKLFGCLHCIKVTATYSITSYGKTFDLRLVIYATFSEKKSRV